MKMKKVTSSTLMVVMTVFPLWPFLWLNWMSLAKEASAIAVLVRAGLASNAAAINSVFIAHWDVALNVFIQ